MDFCPLQSPNAHAEYNMAAVVGDSVLFVGIYLREHNLVPFQVVVDSGILSTTIPGIFESNSQALIKECCWMISNILAGTPDQIQAVIRSNILPLLVEQLDKVIWILLVGIDLRLCSLLSCVQGEFKTQCEAAWAVTNTVTGGTKEQTGYLLSLNVIPPFSKLLTCKDPKIIQTILDGIRLMLEVRKALGLQCIVCVPPESWF